MGAARTLLRRLRAEAYARGGAARRDRHRLDGSRAVVLCYHRVLPREVAARRAVEPGMFVTPATFRLQLAWLSRHFSVISLGEVAARNASGEPFPERALALSFDDGWRDNHEYAWPALREAGLPATVFLVTGRVGTTGAFWTDDACRRLRAAPARLRRELAREWTGVALDRGAGEAILGALKLLPEEERQRRLARLGPRAPAPVDDERELLDWDEVAEMARGGVDFESHGVSHALLTTLPSERARAELAGALAALRERGLGRNALLAFPGGDHDERVIGLARDCGYRAAFTTQPGLVSSSSRHLSLPRVLLHQDVAPTRAELAYRVPGHAWRG